MAGIAYYFLGNDSTKSQAKGKMSQAEGAVSYTSLR